MVAIPFVGPTYTSRSMTLDAQRCVNLYVEEDQGQGGKNVAALYGTPGLALEYTLSTAGGIRGLYTTRRDERVFAVADNALYELNDDLTTTNHGTLNTLRGPVSMSDNATQLCITDGADGYILTLATDTFAQITDGDYLGGGPVTTQDSYFIVVVPSTEQIQISALNDGLSYAAADVSSADGQPDLLVTAMSDERQLWLFGQRSVEVWYNSGNVDFPFERLQGAVIDIGTVSPWVVQSVDNTMVWVGQSERGVGTVYAATGFRPARISTHAIELIITGWANVAQSRAYAYKQEGHTFYVLWNPDGTVAFDFSTGMWHERASIDVATGLLETHRVCCHTYGHAKHLVGDHEAGRVYALDLATYTDNGNAIPRVRAGQYIDGQRRRVKHARFELDFERGVGLDGSPAVGGDPQVQLRWSDDQGQTWSNYHQADMGKLGAHTTRARWYRLGVARERIYEARVTAPVKTALIGAHLNG